MTNTKAIVTLAVGNDFSARWHATCEARWHRYCERHGYDLICIEEPLDTSERARGRSPAWQKCLILGQPFAERYEQVVWVDSDILPNPEAPSIVAGVPLERVGGVDEYSMPSREIHARTLAKLYRRWDADGIEYVRNLTTAEYYRNFDLPPTFDAVVQTGVLVLSPAHHRQLLEDVYARYDDRGPGFNYEMRPLSYELLRAGVVTWLDPRFNYIWGHYKALHFPFLVTHPTHPRATECAAQALEDVHFLHFTGSVPEMAPAATAPAPMRQRRRAISPTRGALRTPVVLLLHARPEPTRRLVELVRAARPSTLLVVADGARDPEEEARCEQTREAVAAARFECDVLTNYADENLGLKRRVESGLDWAFGLVDEAIVLEDDCHPHPTFFGFSEELLARYRDDPRVTTVSGSNFGHGAKIADASYFFSRYPLIWGWATWARAWRHYSPDLAEWPELRARGWLDELFDGDPQAVQYWTYIFDRRRDLADTWDAGWLLGSWLAGGLAAVPTRNLVTNVGFGEDATNTRADYTGIFAGVPALPADSPLRHPARVERDVDADAFLEDVMFSGNLGRLFSRIRASRRVAAPQ